MKLVLDASVALRVVLPSALTPKAIQLRDEFERSVHELIALSIFSGEIASALTKAECQKLIAVGDAQIHFANLIAWAPALTPYESLTGRAIDLSSKTRCGFYDCLYIALAEREGCEMVTADEKLLKAVQLKMPFVISLASLP
jgi:predicted nucleic acid-binding protein